MEDKITIGKPYITIDGESAKLCANVTGPDLDYVCFFQTNERYGARLCRDYSDPFVMMILEYAMALRLDIVCEQPMTDVLYYNLTNYFIPLLSGNTKTFHRVSLTASTEPEDERYLSSQGVGTGLSGGVDSLNVILKYKDFDIPQFRLTHLFFLNNGAMGSTDYDKTKIIFDIEKQHLQRAADELGIEFVAVNTNMMELYGRIPKHRANNNEGLKVAAPIYALRGMIRIYYIASTVGIDKFKFSDMDVGFFAPFTADVVSSDSCRFYIGDLDTPRRIDKVKKIADNTVAQRYLHTNTVKNCGRCPKCIRTQMELLAIRKLDYFEEVYDVDVFKKNKAKYFGKNIADKKEWKFGYNQETIKELYHTGQKMLLVRSVAWGGVWAVWNSCIKIAKMAAKTFLPLKMQEKIKKVVK